MFEQVLKTSLMKTFSSTTYIRVAAEVEESNETQLAREASFAINFQRHAGCKRTVRRPRADSDSRTFPFQPVKRNVGA